MAHWLSEPERAEFALVEEERETRAVAFAVGQPCLRMRQLRWEKLFMSALSRGAPTPVVARETLTRAANRRRSERQKAMRSGTAGLLRALGEP